MGMRLTADSFTPHQRKVAAKLGERIKTRITSLGYRSVEAFLDDKDGLTSTTLYQVVKGERNLTLVNMISIAESLDWSLAELVKGIDS